MKPTSESKVSSVAERTEDRALWEGTEGDEDARLASDEYFMLWVLIAQTKDAILRARELEYARYGISNERRAILAIIQNNGGRATPVDIARDLFRELHSVTEMLARMEKDGLVTAAQGHRQVQGRGQPHRAGASTSSTSPCTTRPTRRSSRR